MIWMFCAFCFVFLFVDLFVYWFCCFYIYLCLVSFGGLFRGCVSLDHE